MATVGFGDFDGTTTKPARTWRSMAYPSRRASSVFLDPYFLATDDPTAPDRFIALGFSRLARLLFVVHLERGEKVRIISARRASRAERKSYEQRRNDPG
jgi:uncharacterized protein